MSLDGANFTMMKRDVEYYRAAYKRQLAVTNQLEHKVGAITDANYALRNRVGELERKIQIKDYVISLRERSGAKLHAEVIETRQEMEQFMDELVQLKGELDDSV